MDRFLAELEAELKAGRYRRSLLRRQYIPKAGGKQRPSGIPRVRDRVVQMSAKIMIEPIFDANFQESSYGLSEEERDGGPGSDPHTGEPRA